jgi:hypothetical protein
MYYASAYAYYKLEFLFRSGALPATLKPARYHLIYLFRKLVNNNSLPRSNSHDMGRLCQTIMEALWDDNVSKSKYLEAADIIIQTAAGNLHRDNIRTEPFTEAITNEANQRIQT